MMPHLLQLTILVLQATSLMQGRVHTPLRPLAQCTAQTTTTAHTKLSPHLQDTSLVEVLLDMLEPQVQVQDTRAPPRLDQVMLLHLLWPRTAQ